MPYFLYKVFPNRKLTHLQTFAKFQEAKAEARSMRERLESEDGYQVKIVFAPTQSEAERLLGTEREAPPLREDDL